MAQTTAFKYEVLVAAAALDEPSGQDIRRWMEHNQNPTLTDDVNHGRLYPNLDTLVEKGYLEKSKKDRRTNLYTLTETAYEAIEERQKWEQRQMAN